MNSWIPTRDSYSFPYQSDPRAGFFDTIKLFADARERIDTTKGLQKKSNEVLSILRPGLQILGFSVEEGKRSNQKIHRPVLFGEMGVPGHKYEIDAYRENQGIVLEIEAGRAIKGNAVYRDLVQMSLMVDARFAVIAMPLSYRHKKRRQDRVTVEVASYESGKKLLEAIYASARLQLPFEGILLVGY